MLTSAEESTVTHCERCWNNLQAITPKRAGLEAMREGWRRILIWVRSFKRLLPFPWSSFINKIHPLLFEGLLPLLLLVRTFAHKRQACVHERGSSLWCLLNMHCIPPAWVATAYYFPANLLIKSSGGGRNGVYNLNRQKWWFANDLFYQRSNTFKIFHLQWYEAKIKSDSFSLGGTETRQRRFWLEKQHNQSWNHKQVGVL